MISQAMFIAALRKGNPDIDPKRALSIWNEVSSKTDLSALSPQQGAQLAYKLAEHSCKSTRHYNNGSPGGVKPVDSSIPTAGPTDISANVNATLPIPEEVSLSTQLKSPYAGTPQIAANPQNPDAASMAAFDPAARERALEEYLRRRSMNAATIGTGFGAEGAQTISNYNTFLKDVTLEHQKGLETQATSGVAAAKSIADRLKLEGEYAGTQAEKQIKIDKDRADLIIKNLDVAQQQRMNKANSPETTMAKTLLLTAIENNPSISSEGRKELSALVKNGEVTAYQMLPAMAKWAPEAHKSYLDQIAANKTIKETQGIGQSQKLVEKRTGVGPDSGSSQGPAPQEPQPTPQPTVTSEPNAAPTFNFKPGTDLRVARAMIEKNEQPNVLAAFDAKYPGVKDATAQPAPMSAVNQQADARTKRQLGNANIVTDYLKQQNAPVVPKAPGGGWDESLYGKKAAQSPVNIGYSTTGGTSVSDSAVVEKRRKDADDEINNTDNLVNGYNTVKNSVNYAFNHAAEGGRANAATGSMKNDSAYNKLAAEVKVLNDAAADLGIIRQTGQGGNAIKAIGGVLQQIPNAVSMSAGSAINAVGSSLSKDTVSASSTEAELKDMATRVAIAKAQNEKLRDYKREFAEKNTDYSLQGFTSTPIFKAVTDMNTYVPLINPKNPSEVVLVHKGDEAEKKKYRDLKYVPAHKYLIQ